jgi:hypothetical protein
MIMALDLTALKTADAVWTTGASQVDNPACEWLRESFATGKAKSVTLEAGNAKELVNMLRSASVATLIGCRIRVSVNGEEFSTNKELWESLEKKPKIKVHVIFKGAERVKRTRKSTTDTPVTTPAVSPAS